MTNEKSSSSSSKSRAGQGARHPKNFVDFTFGPLIESGSHLEFVTWSLEVMRRILFSFVLIGICSLTGTAQTEREAQSEEVKTAVFAYPGKTDDVSVMLRSLVQLKGPISRIDTDNFDLQFRTKGGKRVFQTIRYADVLYLKY